MRTISYDLGTKKILRIACPSMLGAVLIDSQCSVVCFSDSKYSAQKQICAG